MNNREKAKEISNGLWTGEEMNGEIIRGLAKLATLQMANWKDERAKKAFCLTRCGKDADGCDMNCPVLQLFCDELNK